ncbi:PREDICTED: kanadaptin [Acromyrmex echinatior]|uniref:Kanadaptin n=1 Tax=Acromyrmex echinatior TaxID=103372 RepID=F4WLK3_ACREC|nr:PREDICTED: kanadaptin [Acromyrmex echinatior]EGI64939.1 Kanadaptin [Acromyrmex echinatior]
MEANERENDSVISLPKDTLNSNVDASNDEMISKSPTCDEQSIRKSETEDVSESCQSTDTCKEPGFKKPLLLIGPKRGKTGKIRTMKNDTALSPFELSVNKEAIEPIQLQDDVEVKSDKPIIEDSVEEHISSDIRNIPIPYLEPKWGGKPIEEYKLEILKSGVILEKLDLTEKSFYVIGRLPCCNLSLAHPTISRYHAIIQYRAIADEKNSTGFYLYDLESTHGTFWNGHRIKPRTYVRLHGGHMIRFGCSQRKYILQAPPDDQEEESELSVTQLKEKRLEELREREMRQQEEEEAEERAKQEAENEGIDWGMGEDADEETDLTENPYASMADEELYLDDPKKTLRGWFEREGYDLQYQVEEKGIGQFLCWISLPKECFGGRSMKAETLVKGKKKESVIQCALEACRILDRHGLLRQANHESRRKKAKNWEEEDFYDSDEDNFLDRTGTVEKKRKQRMKLAGKIEEKVETYSSLTEKHNEIVNKISRLNERLKEAQRKNAKVGESNEDSLDAFMSSLNTSTLSKSDITKMKVELQNLRKEEIQLVKLVNLTKPANLPPLVSQVQTENKSDSKNLQQKSNYSMKKISQLERRRKLFEANNKSDPANSSLYTMDNEEGEEEEEVEEEEEEDDDDDDEQEENKKNNVIIKEEDASVYKSECKKSTSYEDETKSSDSIKTDDKPIIKNINQEMKKQNVVEKRKKDSKSEKWKNMKKLYDQDVHSEDYSTWVPPQDQSGDGRTNLNDKYGY